MTLDLVNEEKRQKRAKYVMAWVLVAIAAPVVLDFLFYRSSVARFARVVIFLSILAMVLIESKLFLSGKLVGLPVLLGVVFLYLTGTVSAITRGGVATPNVALLILLLLILSLNFDVYETFLKAIGYSSILLIALSVIAIFLKMNPRGIYSSAEGYPVFFDFIGIPGRNYGIFSHPNTLGQAASISLLYIVGTRMNKFFVLLPIICILKSGSRTSLISIGVGLLMYSILFLLSKNSVGKKLRRMENPLVIGAFTLGILLAAVGQFINFLPLLDPNALTGRISIWQVSANLYGESPLFGLGWGWEERAIDSQFLNIWAVSTHNIFLEMLFSTGIAGLILFSGILSKGLLYFTRLSLREKMLLSSVIITGASEAYINLAYPTLETFVFFSIILGSHIERKTPSD